MERMNRIAKELSSLIIYCCSVNKFVMDRVKTKGRIFYEMASFPETAAEKLMCVQDPKFFIWYHQVINAGNDVLRLASRNEVTFLY